MDPLLHPLDENVALPAAFTNPFNYEPDALCRRAMAEVVDYLEGHPNPVFAAEPVASTFAEEIAKGKMFGVLVVASPAPERGRYAYLAGYSGQVCGRSDWPEFVPAVFDYLQPEGYFKRHEAEIVALSHDISQLQQAPQEMAVAPGVPRPVFVKGRREGESEEAYIRRRQFENAELHRWKVAERERTADVAAAQRQKEEKLRTLKVLRRQKSDRLQTWLFRHFIMRNARGEQRDLVDIFAVEGGAPGGSGECCEPKLLQYALERSLRPVSMAMFWWGESPEGEVRHHLQCYPACNSKCRPILRWMLQGIDVMPDPLEADTHHDLEIIYEDEALCVVNKPSGMLAVPGKSGRESVLSVMRARYPESDSPLVVHRLDMDTSGLMVIAKTLAAYHHLQRQFARHEVRKRYVALLSHDLTVSSGTICLPLRPDLADRPRQVVDEVHGRYAETRFERLSPRRIALYPLTGRTHQLRVHCAHRSGLDNPILGDALYGQRSARLHLHAEEITFVHPVNGELVTFKAESQF
jgi:tRNA pseudouridine32 synthase/23S rRNA pseudouridine746 synthase